MTGAVLPRPARPPVSVRQATPDEFPALGALTVAAYRQDGQLTEDYAPVLADVAARARHGTVLAAIDEVTGALLGTVTFVLPGSPYAELSRPGEAEFRTLAVAPEAQRRGVGAALVRACVERAAALGCRAVVICTRDFALGAQRMYQRLGFERDPALDWSPAHGINLLALRLPLAEAYLAQG